MVVLFITFISLEKSKTASIDTNQLVSDKYQQNTMQESGIHFKKKTNKRVINSSDSGSDQTKPVASTNPFKIRRFSESNEDALTMD